MSDHSTEQAWKSTELQARRGGGAAHRILVVDDDAALLQLSTQVLSGSGYRADAADDGAVAWQALKTGNYDLLITDHNMPNVTGVELVKRLRAARMTLPVILVSGAMPTEELDCHSELGIEATLPKPFAVGALLETVQEVLRMNRRGATGREMPLTTDRASPGLSPHMFQKTEAQGTKRLTDG